MSGSPLLIPEPPLQVLPSLAKKIGVNEAIFLQQLHYWSLHKEPDDDGYVWVYKSQAEWLEEMPWLGERTLRRVTDRLRDEHGFIAEKQPEGTNRRKHYRVLYEALPEAAKMAGSTGQNGRLTNTSTEKTTENQKSKPKKKVNKKLVSDNELSLAAVVVDLFNSSAGTALSVEAHLTPIVGRIREHPDYGERQHRAIIEAVFAGEHWWTGPPSPKVIYGNPSIFEQSIELARSKQRKEKDTIDINAEAARIRREQGLE